MVKISKTDSLIETAKKLKEKKYKLQESERIKADKAQKSHWDSLIKPAENNLKMMCDESLTFSQKIPFDKKITLVAVTVGGGKDMADEWVNDYRYLILYRTKHKFEITMSGEGRLTDEYTSECEKVLKQISHREGALKFFELID